MGVDVNRCLIPAATIDLRQGFDTGVTFNTRAAACVRASCTRGKAANLFSCARGGLVGLLIWRPVGWGGGGVGGWGHKVWGGD